jgi:kynureninase
MTMDATKEYAIRQDEQDPLCRFRDLFVIPSKADLTSKTLKPTTTADEYHEPSIYLCGNSLGLQPTLARKYFQQYLDTWATKGVFGHFKEVEDSNLAPWMHVDEDVQADMADLVGAKPSEIAIMQTLTANLHLMMASFYQPTKERWKIIIEGKAFPSDHVSLYALRQACGGTGFCSCASKSCQNLKKSNQRANTSTLIFLYKRMNSIRIELTMNTVRG